MRGLPSWASQLSDGAPPALVVEAVRLAASSGPAPARVHRVVTQRLEDNSGTDAAAVFAALRERDAPLEGACDPAPADVLARGLLSWSARVAIVGWDGYPTRLAGAWPELGAPLWLFRRGAVGAFEQPAVAVVGTRHPSHEGLRTAEELGRLLAGHGVTVVSGMARGIDQAAHRGALAVGGPTVAVLGTGLDVAYPAKSATLHSEVAAAGAVVTEYPLRAPPRPQHFLARNRIISGLADACVVVEGAARSGALQTARLAAEQGREVLAVPGSLHARTSEAPLDLIRDGARPLTRLTDVLEVVDLTAHPASDRRERRPPPRDLHPHALAVLRLLTPVPAAAGVLSNHAQLPVSAVLVAVGELVDRGLATTTPRGVVAGS